VSLRLLYLAAMPGFVPSAGVLMTKLVSLFPRNAGTGLPTHQAMIAETAEESGMTVEVTGLVGIYTDPGHVIAGPDAGLVRQPFAVCFHACPLSGSPGGDQVETSDARWFTASDLAVLPIGPAMRLRIGHALTPGRPCHIGWPRPQRRHRGRLDLRAARPVRQPDDEHVRDLGRPLRPSKHRPPGPPGRRDGTGLPDLGRHPNALTVREHHCTLHRGQEG
jgi:ADP-ribose pyrophosphatase YjhB (NUDIX family)